MYANLHTFIFAFILIFFNNVQTTAKRLQNDRKKGKTKNSLSLSLRKSKSKTFHQHKGKPYQLSPNHEEHSTPFIITDF